MYHLLVALFIVIVGLTFWAASPIATFAIIAWLLFAAGGYVIGQPKGRGIAGIVLGGFLGPIGLLVVALLRPTPASTVQPSWYDV